MCNKDSNLINQSTVSPVDKQCPISQVASTKGINCYPSILMVYL